MVDSNEMAMWFLRIVPALKRLSVMVGMEARVPEERVPTERSAEPSLVETTSLVDPFIQTWCKDITP